MWEHLTPGRSPRKVGFAGCGDVCSALTGVFRRRRLLLADGGSAPTGVCVRLPDDGWLTAGTRRARGAKLEIRNYGAVHTLPRRTGPLRF